MTPFKQQPHRASQYCCRRRRKLGDQNPQQNTKILAIPQSSITRDPQSTKIWDHRNISTWSHRSINDWDHWKKNIWDYRRIISNHRSIIQGRRINIIWHPRSIAIWGCWPIIARAQRRDQPSAEEGPCAHNSGGTPAGKLRNRIYGINTGRPRATSALYGLCVHPQANLRLSILPERRTHQHRDQETDTDCMINSGGHPALS